jgi:N-acetylneuraminate synthase/N,N'-diacetyllegionaminate synthase
MGIKIADKTIGEGQPCFIIAEAGVNHNGDVTLARKLVDVAKEAGADAVKFQTFKTEELVTRNAEKASYQKRTTKKEESQFKMLKGLELSEKAHSELKVYADSQGIIFLSTPFDIESVDFLAGLGVPALKVSSGDITNHPFLFHIAGKKLPVILSTGMSTLSEVEEAVKVIVNGGNRQIVLLHCVSCYPARIEDMNLRNMQTLSSKFNRPVGLSDHSTGITVPIAAVALGACVIEKHFTLDKRLPGPDHKASVTPRELKQIVKAIRDVEKAMGDGILKSSAEEEENKKAGRRSIVTRCDIPRGTTITQDMLAVKRPGTGIEPKYFGKIAGRVAKEDIKKDTLITWDKIR